MEKQIAVAMGVEKADLSMFIQARWKLRILRFRTE